MNILAFDTSTQACSIALQVDDKCFNYHEIAPKLHAELILPQIDILLKKAQITLDDLDCIAFGKGPGSFTGIRIATAVAKALSFALEVPILPISSLAIIAQTALAKKNWQHVLVAVDAYMKEVYWAYYQVNHEGLMTLVDTEQVSSPTEAFRTLNKTYPLSHGVGNAWQIYEDTLKQNVSFAVQAVDYSLLPDATALVTLASHKLSQSVIENEQIILPSDLR